MYAVLEKYGDQSQAINWAENLMSQHNSNDFSKHNPCTTVFKLVEELNGKSQQLNDEIMKKMRTGK